MRVHWLQHVEYEDLGSIADWLQRNRAEVRCTRLYAGEQAPPQAHDFDWLIVMGGPMNVYEHAQYPWLITEQALIQKAIRQRKTVLGICLGAQLIASVLHARVFANPVPEIGWFPVRLAPEIRVSALFADWPDKFDAFHWHGDTFGLPVGGISLGASDACERQGFVARERVVGLQFHLEMTPDGAQRLCRMHPPQPARTVQSAERMLGRLARFEKANRRLAGLLDRLRDL
jgi:GMP synthase-like glutamine amidotransferase